MPDHDPVDTAWRIHGAIVGWTISVDSKASFALAIEAAVMAGLIKLAGNGRLSDLEGYWEKLLFWSGVVALTGGLLAVLLVVRPRLRARRLKHEVAGNFIYFGHAKDWDGSELEEALKERDVLPVLSRQIVKTSKVAWMKHRLLQSSMTLAVIGTALVAMAAWLND
jgi:hypothetical protein